MRNKVNMVDLCGSVAAAGGHAGVVWTLRQGDDLNANPVRFPAGEGVGEHVDENVSVLVVEVSGSGVAAVDGQAHPLRAGTVAFVPRGARPSSTGGPADFACGFGVDSLRQAGALREHGASTAVSDPSELPEEDR